MLQLKAERIQSNFLDRIHPVEFVSRNDFVGVEVILERQQIELNFSLLQVEMCIMQ